MQLHLDIFIGIFITLLCVQNYEEKTYKATIHILLMPKSNLKNYNYLEKFYTNKMTLGASHS